MPIVAMPDGTRVQFPDDMPPGRIQNLIRQKFPDAVAGIESQQPPAEQPSAPATAPETGGYGRALQVGVQGAGRGLADLVGGPVDLATAGMNTLLSGADLAAGPFGGSVDFRLRDPVMGSEWISDKASGVAEGLGLDLIDQEDMSFREKAAHGINRFGGQAALAAGTLASPAVQAATQTPQRAGTFLGNLARPYKDSAAPVVGDAIAGAGAGLGEASYEHFVPEPAKDAIGPVGNVLAMILGGAGASTLNVGAQAAGTAAKNAVRDRVHGPYARDLPLDEATGLPFRNTDVDAASAQVQARASNPKQAAGAIGERAAELRAAGPDSALPPTGMLSDDPGLAVFENANRQQNPVPFIERGRQSNTQARSLVDELSTVDAEPRDFTNRAAEILEAQDDYAQRQVDRMRGRQDKVGEIRRAHGEEIDAFRGQKPAAAATIDETVVEGNLRPRTEQSNRMYSAADPERRAPIDAEPLLETAQRVRDSLGELNTPDKVLPRGLLARIDAQQGAPEQTVQSSITDASGRPYSQTIPAEPSEVAVGDIVQVMPEISTTIERARRARNFTLADNLTALRTQMNGMIDEAAEAGNEAAQRAVAARQNYAENVAPIWNQGPKDEAARFRKDFNQDRQNRSTTPASQTAGRFLRPGQPEKAQSLRRIVETAENPGAGRAAVHDYLMADMAEAGVLDRTGVIRPDALRKWRDRWGEALSEAPGTKSQVDDLLKRAQRGERLSGDLAQQVKKAEKNLQETQRNRGALGLVTGKDPGNAVAAVFSSGDPERAMEELVGTVGRNDRAREGLKAAVRDHLLEKTTTTAVQNTTDGSRPVSFAQLDKVFRQNEKALSKLYSPKEMNSLRQAHAFLKPYKNREMQATSGSATAERAASNADDFWKFAEIGLKAKYGILKGGGMLRTLRLWASTLPSNDEAVKRVIHQMWFDPELAQHLLTRPVAEVNSPAWNSKLNRLLAYGEGAREMSEPLAEPVE